MASGALLAVTLCIILQTITAKSTAFNVNDVIVTKARTEETSGEESTEIAQSNATTDPTSNVNRFLTEENLKTTVETEMNANKYDMIDTTAAVSSNSTISNQTETYAYWRGLAIAAFAVICFSLIIGLLILFVKCARRNKVKRAYKKEYKKVARLRQKPSTRGVPSDQVRWSVVRVQGEDESQNYNYLSNILNTQRALPSDSARWSTVMRFPEEDS